MHEQELEQLVNAQLDDLRRHRALVDELFQLDRRIVKRKARMLALALDAAQREADRHNPADN